MSGLPLELQIRHSIERVEIPVQRLDVRLLSTRRRDEARPRPSGDVVVRWLRHQLVRLPWRYVLAGDVDVEYSDAHANLFLAAQREWRASVRVMFPPTGALVDVDEYHVGTAVLEVPLAMPSPRAR